jgi:hypothetical protein
MEIGLDGLDLRVIDDNAGRSVPLLAVATGAGSVALRNWSAHHVRRMSRERKRSMLTDKAMAALLCADGAVNHADA